MGEKEKKEGSVTRVYPKDVIERNMTKEKGKQNNKPQRIAVSCGWRERKMQKDLLIGRLTITILLHYFVHVYYKNMTMQKIE